MWNLRFLCHFTTRGSLQHAVGEKSGLGQYSLPNGGPPSGRLLESLFFVIPTYLSSAMHRRREVQAGEDKTFV